jgi:hypothetical protein
MERFQPESHRRLVIRLADAPPAKSSCQNQDLGGASCFKQRGNIDALEETKTSTIIGGIVGGGAGLLLGIDPVISAGCLAMTVATADSVMLCKDIESSPGEPISGPTKESDSPGSEKRFERLVAAGREAGQRIR